MVVMQIDASISPQPLKIPSLGGRLMVRQRFCDVMDTVRNHAEVNNHNIL
jgi:hypothetical protein